MIAVFIYGCVKFDTVIAKTKMDVQESIERGFYTPENEFTSGQGLRIAAMITSSLGEEEFNISDIRVESEGFKKNVNSVREV